MVTALGLVAGLLTSGCWLPQLARSWRSRSTGDLSWLYLAALAAGVGLWLAYGLAIGDLVILVTNGLTLTAISVLALLKLRFDRLQAGRLRGDR